MVMVVNQNETETVKTLENYRAAAQALLPAVQGSSSAGGYGSGYGSTSAATGAATATGSVTTITPAGQSGPGPSYVGSATGSASPSIQTFNGDASRALQVWGGSWSVGLVAVGGVAAAMWL